MMLQIVADRIDLSGDPGALLISDQLIVFIADCPVAVPYLNLSDHFGSHAIRSSSPSGCHFAALPFVMNSCP